MEVKSREEVLAERKLRKAAKQSKKQNSTSKQANKAGESPHETLPHANKPNHEGQTATGEVSECSPISEKVSTKKNKTTNPAASAPNKSCHERTPNANELGKKMENLKISKTESDSPLSNEVSPKTNKIVHSPASCRSVPETNAINDAKKTVEQKANSDVQPDGMKVEALGIEGTKSKTQLKAERRALQEAQRALKAQKKANEIVKPDSSEPGKSVTAKPKAKQEDKVTKTNNNLNKVKMISHLYLDTCTTELEKYSGIHQSVIQLGLQYKHRVIIGSNARVVAFLNTLREVLSDFTCEHNFPRQFEVALESTVQYLKTCRPPSVSMTNAVKFLKLQLTQLPNNIPSSEAQIKLGKVIEDYLNEIDLAGLAISNSVQEKIAQNDVILTFGYSSLIKRILKESFKKGVKFRVVIVDTGPLFEGKQLLKQLAKKNLHCTYVLLSAASYIMKEATKVLLGAHALLTNGYVMSRAGASQVALIARAYNVPVLVCCETHKFSERVQTDALVYNELGDPVTLKNDLAKSNSNYRKSLTLMYDVTPSDLVTAVVTEIAILPCSSVPVVLRVKPANPTFS